MLQATKRHASASTTSMAVASKRQQQLRQTASSLSRHKQLLSQTSLQGQKQLLQVLVLPPLQLMARQELLLSQHQQRMAMLVKRRLLLTGTRMLALW
jgi:hypothetical protein